MDPDEVKRPWWIDDLYTGFSHFQKWLDTYFVALLSVLPAATLVIPDAVEKILTPNESRGLQLTLLLLWAIKTIRDARRPQNTRSEDVKP